MFTPTPVSPMPIICIPPGIPVPIYGLDLRGALPSLKSRLQLKNGSSRPARNGRGREGFWEDERLQEFKFMAPKRGLVGAVYRNLCPNQLI